MPAPLRVVHAKDPKQDIIDDVSPFTDRIHPLGVELLVAVYERGKQSGGGEIKSAGGIIIPKVIGDGQGGRSTSGTLGEDKHQGKVGLVMKIGPAAFIEDAAHRWGERTPQVGDWVVFNVGDTFGYDLPCDRRVRQVQDVDVHAITDDPDIIW